MMLTTLLLTSVALTPPLAGDGCQASESRCSASAALASATGGRDLVETAVEAGTFKTLAAALQAAGLVDALKAEGPFTVFAPTDEAFAALPDGTLESLLKPENRATLRTILTYHVVPGAVAASDVVKLENAAALNGQRLAIDVSEAGVRVAGVKVVKTDVRATNGIIHVIDRVMMPNTEDVVGTAMKTEGFSTLTAAIKAAGLVEALRGKGPITVFAPTDEAFAKLPKGALEDLLRPENREKLAAVLKLHVVSGRIYSEAAAKGAEVATLEGQKIRTKSMDGSVYVNGARVVEADIDTTNGVIHVIDTVLMPR